MGATISWAAAGISERTTIKYGDRDVRYIYYRRPASMPDHGSAEGVILPSLLYVHGFGSCAPGGWLLGAGRESSSMIFSRGGRIRVVGCRTNGRSG